jgi:hypothetical protein
MAVDGILLCSFHLANPISAVFSSSFFHYSHDSEASLDQSQSGDTAIAKGDGTLSMCASELAAFIRRLRTLRIWD